MTTTQIITYEEALTGTIEEYRTFLMKLTHDREKLRRLQIFLEEKKLLARYRRWEARQLAQNS